jgi:hypothetical protein
MWAANFWDPRYWKLTYWPVAYFSAYPNVITPITYLNAQPAQMSGVGTKS